MRLVSVVGFAVVSGMLLTLCVADASKLRPLEAVWSTELDVVAGPRMAGGAWSGDPVLAYVTDAEEGRLDLVALDSSTGEEIWRQEASPGAVQRTQRISPRVVSGYPVYFRANDAAPKAAELVVADPDTGEDIVVSEVGLFTSLPMACGDARAVCVLGFTESDGETNRWRQLWIDGTASRYQSFEEYRVLSDVPEEGNPVGPRELVLYESGNDEHLAVYEQSESGWEAGEESWRVTVDEVFGEDYSIEHGRHWSYDEPSDLYLGSVGFAPEIEGDVRSYDMDRGKLVAIDRLSGEVAWRQEGVYDNCSEKLWIPQAESVEHYQAPIPVRCRVQGKVSIETILDTSVFEEGIIEEQNVTLEDTRITLEGYDIASGETEWQYELDDAFALLGWNFRDPSRGDTPIVRGEGSEVVFSVDGERKAIDLETGTTRPAPYETYWCAGQLRAFAYLDPATFYTSGGIYIGEHVYEWCDMNGEPIEEDTVSPRFMPGGISVHAGDLMIVATPDGLAAFRD